MPPTIAQPAFLRFRVVACVVAASFVRMSFAPIGALVAAGIPILNVLHRWRFGFVVIENTTILDLADIAWAVLALTDSDSHSDHHDDRDDQHSHTFHSS